MSDDGTSLRLLYRGYTDTPPPVNIVQVDQFFNLTSQLT